MDLFGLVAQEHCNLFGGAIAAFDPNDFGWVAVQQTFFVKIRIFADESEAVSAGIFLNLIVVGCTESHPIHMCRFLKQVGEFRDELW